MSSPSSSPSELPRSSAELLAEKYPPLARYWPNLQRVSAPQTAFLVLDTLEAFYGGAAGGGKSDALLAGALQYVDVPGYAALILRRTFKQLSLPGAIMARSKQWLKPHRELHWSDDDKTWTFPSGATLTFGFLEHPDDIYRYQGPEFQYIGFDELTQFHLGQYTYMFSRLRRHVEIPVPIRLRAASNPGGVGHAWVNPRFPIRKGSTPAQHEGRIFVPAKIADNPGLDKDEYERSLSELPEVLRKQLMNGDWGAFEGAAYQSFDHALHIVEPFDIPTPWERFESMDFGSTNPTCWLAWAIDYDGNLICFDEFYEPGLPSDTAPKVQALRAAWWPEGVTPICYADPSVYAGRSVTNRWGREATIADEFLEHGISLHHGNNDRAAGYVRLAQLLRPDPLHRFPAWHPLAGQPGSPRVFFMPACENLISQIQAAPLEGDTEPNPGEAVSRKWEGPYGHAHAAARYGVMSWPGPSEQPRDLVEEMLTPPDDPNELRAAALREREEQLNRPVNRRRAYHNV